MACTVTQLAKLSGVTVRTLRFYDQIGLLKPARVGANGYRYYEEPELLRLQQILFHRELGFDPEKQAGHERYLIDRYGATMKEAIAASRRRVRNWTRDDWERSGAGFAALCRELAGLRQSGHAAGSADVQEVIRRHHRWLMQFWTPNRESYIGHAQLIVDSELRQAYEAHDPGLADLVAEAIPIFARQELD